MRILSLRFANINSLAGEWHIDFTHGAYRSDGLFAITGPTGAGKSSILDALCLGLYGRTPRLERVNKSGNELMSRHRGECFAEVCFSTGAGEFRCHWSQRRARRRAEGELQPPRQELADARSGEVLASGLREVASALESATGLDFERFTRAMLLAQGGFAAFLQAAPDERAPLLERITGTALYSDISIAVHERRAAERGRLDAQLAELAALQVLPPDEEDRLRAALARDSAQETALAQRIGACRASLAWREGIAGLEAELQQLQASAQALAREREAFAPQAQRLQAAARALELDAAHAALQAQREAREQERAALAAARECLPQLQAADGRARARARQAVEERDAARTRHFEQQPLLREVRALDQRLAAQEQRREELLGEVDGLQGTLQRLQGEAQAVDGRLRAQREELERLQAWLREQRDDARLVEELAALRQQVEALQGVAREQQARAGDLQAAERDLERARALQERERGQREQLGQALRTVESSLQQRQGEREALLEGRSSAGWRSERAALTEQQRRATTLLDALRQRDEARDRLERQRERAAELRRDLQALEPAIARAQAQQETLDRSLELLETQRLLLQRVDSLEQARAQLVDGEPCPLCGSPAHPWAEGATPDSDATREELAAQRRQRRELAAALDGQRQQRASLLARLEELAGAVEEGTETLDRVQGQLENLLANAPPELPGGADSATLAAALAARGSELAQVAAGIDQRLQRVDAVDGALASLAEERAEKGRQLAAAELALAAAAHAEERCAAAQRDARDDLAALERRHRQLLQTLREAVAPWSRDGVEADAFGELLAALAQRRDAWLAAEERRAELERAIAAGAAAAGGLAEQITQRRGELAAREADLQGLESSLVEQRQRRAALLGERDADDAEAQLQAAVQAADAALEAARGEAADSERALRASHTRIEELEPALARREDAIRAAEQRFAASLAQQGFADEAAYRAACLDAAERQRLGARSEALASRAAALQAQQTERRRRLDAERQRALTSEPDDALRSELEGLEAQQRQLQEALGACRQRLADNDRRREQQRRRRDAVEAQQRECRRWEDLHALIGSADGKKYRNFAQGLTFELMVGHANRQLQKMSDRYLLIHEAGRPLELSVVDNYQGGEVRSTRNLSGGESFIVSLALALGLAGMASRRLRVDSLFLDEGFGTLDEDALDTALEALAGLQQEGKLIGVISHVGMLKERIATQIRVTPQSGGRSVLSGPGCGPGGARSGEERPSDS